jgi:cytidine deaminase
MNNDFWDPLLEVARQSAQQAYAPYSKFAVGAALLCLDGTIVKGCNVENASYGLCICAERTAATTAIMQGQRDWKAIAVVSPTGVSPCGACRQFLAEFAPEIEIAIGTLTAGSGFRTTNLAKLLPDQMNLEL